MAVDGSWTIGFRTPAGDRQADLVFRVEGQALTGTFDGVPIEDGRAEGDELSFSTVLTVPFRMKVKCQASVEGDTITGKAKVGFKAMEFSGTRTSI